LIEYFSQILKKIAVPLDYVTYIFFLINFAGAGVLVVFVTSPLIIQQMVLVFVSVFMGYIISLCSYGFSFFFILPIFIILFILVQVGVVFSS
jgi:hypothetical protein